MLSIAGKHLSGGFVAAHRAFSAAAEAVKKLYVGNIAWASECLACSPMLCGVSFCKKKRRGAISVSARSLQFASERETALHFNTSFS
jgi:hypothetical protein